MHFPNSKRLNGNGGIKTVSLTQPQINKSYQSNYCNWYFSSSSTQKAFEMLLLNIVKYTKPRVIKQQCFNNQLLQKNFSFISFLPIPTWPVWVMQFQCYRFRKVSIYFLITLYYVTTANNIVSVGLLYPSL